MGRSLASMRWLAFAVLLIAIDFAAVRLGTDAMTGRADLVLAVFGVLPLANIVAIVGYRTLSRRAEARPFLVGFALTGLLVIVAWFATCMTIDKGLLQNFADWLWDTFTGSALWWHMAWPIKDPYVRSILQVIGALAFYLCLAVPPQLLVSLLGGRIASRLASSRRPALPA